MTHDCVWKPICQEYSILSTDAVLHRENNSSNSNSPPHIYFDIFKRSLTSTKNWKLFQSKRYELHFNKGPILSLLVADLTRVFSGDIDGSVHVWNALSNQYVTSLNAHRKHVSCLTCHNHLLASGSSDTTIAIHHIFTFEQINILRGHEGPVTSLVFIPTRTNKSNNNVVLLASGSTDRTIRIWDITNNTCLRILHGQENTIMSLAFSASIPLKYCHSEADSSSVKNNMAGYIISGSNDRNIFVWDLKTSVYHDTPQVINSIMNTNGPVTAMAVYDELSTVGPSQAFITNNTITARPKTMLSGRKPIDIPPFVIFAGLADATTSLYSIPGLEKTYIETPNVHRATIWSITVATLHSKIITTSGDRTAMIWDLKSPKNCTTLGGFDSAVVASATSPKEEILCFGTEKGTIVVFDLQEFY